MGVSEGDRVEVRKVRLRSLFSPVREGLGRQLAYGLDWIEWIVVRIGLNGLWLGLD